MYIHILICVYPQDITCFVPCGQGNRWLCFTHDSSHTAWLWKRSLKWVRWGECRTSHVHCDNLWTLPTKPSTPLSISPQYGLPLCLPFVITPRPSIKLFIQGRPLGMFWEHVWTSYLLWFSSAYPDTVLTLVVLILNLCQFLCVKQSCLQSCLRHIKCIEVCVTDSTVQHEACRPAVELGTQLRCLDPTGCSETVWDTVSMRDLMFFK